MWASDVDITSGDKPASAVSHATKEKKKKKRQKLTVHGVQVKHLDAANLVPLDAALLDLAQTIQPGSLLAQKGPRGGHGVGAPVPLVAQALGGALDLVELPCAAGGGAGRDGGQVGAPAGDGVPPGGDLPARRVHLALQAVGLGDDLAGPVGGGALLGRQPAGAGARVRRVVSCPLGGGARQDGVGLALGRLGLHQRAGILDSALVEVVPRVDGAEEGQLLGVVRPVADAAVQHGGWLVVRSFLFFFSSVLFPFLLFPMSLTRNEDRREDDALYSQRTGTEHAVGGQPCISGTAALQTFGRNRNRRAGSGVLSG